MKRIKDETLKGMDRHIGRELRSALHDAVILQRDTLYRLAKLIEMKAPRVILWNEAQPLNPFFKIWTSKPQKAIYDRWAERTLIGAEVDPDRKWCLRLHTAEGTLLFGPCGRWGPWYKEVE
jgi:hypothetical protein